MKQNMGTIDRAVRIILALVVVALSIANIISGTLAIILGAVAGILALTSAMGFCPLYIVANLSTKKTEAVSKS
jgi:hypothetical protein